MAAKLLEKLLDKSEEIQVYYEGKEGLRMCEMKQKINRPYWITLRFEYKTKRGRYISFNFSLGISPSAKNIYQNFGSNRHFLRRSIASTCSKCLYKY